MKKLLIIAIFSLLMSNLLLSQEIIVNPALENNLILNDNNQMSCRITSLIGKINYSEILNEDGSFIRFSLPEYSWNMNYGTPELPVHRKLIEIPLESNPEIKIISSSFTEIDLSLYGITKPVYPAQPPQSKSEDIHEFEYNTISYSTNKYFSNELITVDVLGILRANRLARLNIAPVQYNPVTNTLKVYDRIEFEIIYKNANIQATNALKEKYSSIYFESLNSLYFNHIQSANRENFTKYPVKYVIISDRMFEDQLQPFIEWKKLKGFTIVEAYTDEPNVGNTTSTIKAYIQNLYNAGTPEDPAPSFILFVGDIQQIPEFNNGNGATDRNYCEFTGDLFPEIFYGRFSAQTEAQLQPYVDKTIQYEKYTMPDPSYLEEIVLVSGVDASHSYNWGNGQINYGTINYFNEDHGILSHTYLYPASGSSSAAIIQDISNGVTFGNYTAHCSPSGWADPPFVISDIPTLQNQDQYGVLIGNCCSSSEYQQNECFAEALLRAENKGTVGYIGASNSTYWDEDYYFGVGVGTIAENPPSYEETTLGCYDRAFHDHGEIFQDWFVTGDQFIYAGNLAVTEGSAGSAEYYWDIYNFMGDPSIMVYFGIPEDIYVNHMPLIPLSSTLFTVNTDPYAYVAISKDGVLHGVQLADANGLAEVELSEFTVPGTADVVITKQNGKPYFGTVIVANPEGPFLLLDDFIIEDSLGNNNHHADYNELISLDVALENLGNTDGQNTSATISCINQNIILTDNYQEWGVVGANSIAWQENAYTFMVQDVIPDGHILNFDMEIQSEGKEIWNADFSITLNAPVLTIDEMIIDDSQGGNGNGVLDPGETAILKIKNRNTGHCESEDAIATLEAYNAYVTFVNQTAQIGKLGTFGFKYAEFEIQIDPACPAGAIISEFIYTIQAGPYNNSNIFREKIGIIYDDFETGNFDKFDWQMGGDQAWTINSLYPWEGLYDAKSGQISDGENTELDLTLNVMTADTIYFVRKISSQSNQDKLKFYVDNSFKEEWSGTSAGWKQTAMYAPAGIHTFKWIYQKDGQGSSGSDCAWIDFVIMPPLMALTCYAGPDDVSCEDGDYQCNGQATDYSTVGWTTSGSGTFSSSGILDPIYYPSSDDILAGSVILTLSVTGNNSSNIQDELTITFISSPETPEQPQGPENVNYVSMPISYYTIDAVDFTETYSWDITPAEAGAIEGNTEQAKVIWNSEFSGTAHISVKAINSCGESSFSQSLDILVNSSVGIIDVTSDERILLYPNPAKDLVNISFNISRPVIGNLKLINNMGSVLLQNNNLFINNGSQIELNTQQLSPGIYFVLIESDTYRIVEKLIIL